MKIYIFSDIKAHRQARSDRKHLKTLMKVLTVSFLFVSAVTAAEAKLHDPKAVLKIKNTSDYVKSAFDRKFSSGSDKLYVKDFISLGQELNFNKLADKECSGLELNEFECQSDVFERLSMVKIDINQEVILQLQRERIEMIAILNKFNEAYPGGSMSTLSFWAEAALNSAKEDWLAFDLNFGAKYNLNDDRMKKLNEILESSKSEIVNLNDKEYVEHVRYFKKWVMKNKFSDDTLDLEPKPDDFIESRSLEDFVSVLNDPSWRFKVSSIEPGINLRFVMAQNGWSKVLTDEMRNTLNRNFESFKSKFGVKTWAFDMNLREFVFKYLISDPSEETKVTEITEELIKYRIKAFGRIVEGAIRSIQEGKNPIDEIVVTRIIKAWIMAKQMGEFEGWKDEKVKYGLLPLDKIKLDMNDNLPDPPPSQVQDQSQQVNTLGGTNVVIDKIMEGIEARERLNSTGSIESIESIIGDEYPKKKKKSIKKTFGDFFKGVKSMYKENKMKRLAKDFEKSDRKFRESQERQQERLKKMK